jgi:hypothetical protein
MDQTTLKDFLPLRPVVIGTSGLPAAMRKTPVQ